MAGRMVDFASNGGTASGYLATPASGTGPGVLVIQEWWGLNDQIKGVADMLAREGLTALAPDLFHGKSARIGEPDEAGKLMMSAMSNLQQVAKDVRGAAQYLARNDATSSKKVGVIGFCMGGLLALFSGTVAPNEIGAVVDCYGVPPAAVGWSQKPDYAKLKGAPALGIFGGKDGYATPDVIRQLESDLKAAGASFEKHVYPEADHGFLNEQRRDVYRPNDAKDAWGKIVPFLKKNVR